MASLGAENAVSRLVSIIRQYESDTFSADGSGITELEARAVVTMLIERIEDHLDGVTIDALLSELREPDLVEVEDGE